MWATQMTPSDSEPRARLIRAPRAIVERAFLVQLGRKWLTVAVVRLVFVTDSLCAHIQAVVVRFVEVCGCAQLQRRWLFFSLR